MLQLTVLAVETIEAAAVVVSSSNGGGSCVNKCPHITVIVAVIVASMMWCGGHDTTAVVAKNAVRGHGKSSNESDTAVEPHRRVKRQ